MPPNANSYAMAANSAGRAHRLERRARDGTRGCAQFFPHPGNSKCGSAEQVGRKFVPIHTRDADSIQQGNIPEQDIQELGDFPTHIAVRVMDGDLRAVLCHHLPDDLLQNMCRKRVERHFDALLEPDGVDLRQVGQLVMDRHSSIRMVSLRSGPVDTIRIGTFR